MKVRGQPKVQFSPSIWLEMGVSSSPLHPPGYPACEFPGFLPVSTSHLPFRNSGVRGTLETTPRFHKASGDSNSGSHTCAHGAVSQGATLCLVTGWHLCSWNQLFGPLLWIWLFWCCLPYGMWVGIQSQGLHDYFTINNKDQTFHTGELIGSYTSTLTNMNTTESR